MRNCSDGTVEAVFEGPQDAVSALVEFTRGGRETRGSQDLDVSSEEPEGLQGFEVR